jgi:hypothetical protein
MVAVFVEDVGTVGNNSGAFYTFLLYKLSQVYIDPIAPIIIIYFRSTLHLIATGLAQMPLSLYPVPISQFTIPSHTPV